MPVEHRPADVAFNRWLERSLREQHPAATLEPVPEALMKLLRDET